MIRKKNAKGFTLIELVIVIVIVGILSAVSVPIYKSYTRKAMASEGKALISAIANAEKVYYAEHSSYTTDQGVTGLNINCATNKYFTAATISGASAAGYTVTANGSGDAANIVLTGVATNTGPMSITESGI